MGGRMYLKKNSTVISANGVLAGYLLNFGWAEATEQEFNTRRDQNT